jgi:ubiquinone/menaquinone biosynthesis C-methylase UbiE
MATGTAASLAAEAVTPTARDCNSDAMTDHDDVVRRSFDRQVGLFSGPDSPFVRRPAGTLEQLAPLTREMLVLDVACGAGHAAEVVAPEVRQVVGLDLTVSLLDLGAARLRDAVVPNVLLQEGNAHSLPFVAASFDLVYCLAALHHVGDPARAVAEMARVCRPGGRVVLSDLIAPAADVREPFDELHRRIDPSHRRACLEGELVALLPEGCELSYGATVSARLPVSIAYTDQSDTEAVDAALRTELAGGPPTGFEPSEDDGELVVSFWQSTVHATWPVA